MVNFMSYRTLGWLPELDCAGLLAEHERYHTVPVIGAVQHMCQDLAIGLRLGWCGLLDKVCEHAPTHPEAADFYAGLEAIILGMQNWIGRHADAADALAKDRPEFAVNLT